MMRRQLLFAVFSVSLIGCASMPVSKPVGLHDERTDRIARVIKQTMREQKIPGLSIAVIDGGQLVWAQGFGLRDQAKRLPVDTETEFQAGSVSKPVTALALLRLAAEGKLKLDDDINTCLKSWHLESPYSQPVTLRQLACHRGGTAPHGFLGFSELKKAPSLIEAMNTDSPGNGAVTVIAEPGVRFQYSGGGYCIIQTAMEDVTGTPFDQLMAQTLLEPLNMTRSHYHQPPLESDTANCACGYGSRPNRQIRWNVYPQKSAAGLWTTPTDLAKLVMAIQKAAAGDDTGPIAPAVAQEFLKPQFDEDHGFGVFIDKPNGVPGFFHNGENHGFVAGFGASVSTGRGWVIMINAQKYKVAPIQKAIAEEFGWK